MCRQEAKKENFFEWILKKISELWPLFNLFFFLTEKYDHFETAYKEKKRKWGMGGG
jgi:hypothetical protein